MPNRDLLLLCIPCESTSQASWNRTEPHPLRIALTNVFLGVPSPSSRATHPTRHSETGLGIVFRQHSVLCTQSSSLPLERDKVSPLPSLRHANHAVENISRSLAKSHAWWTTISSASLTVPPATNRSLDCLSRCIRNAVHLVLGPSSRNAKTTHHNIAHTYRNITGTETLYKPNSRLPLRSNHACRHASCRQRCGLPIVLSPTVSLVLANLQSRSISCVLNTASPSSLAVHLLYTYFTYNTYIRPYHIHGTRNSRLATNSSTPTQKGLACLDAAPSVMHRSSQDRQLT